VLFGSGLIAGGAIMGVVIAALQAKGLDAVFDLSKTVGWFSSSIVVAMIIYIAALSIPLYRVGRRPA
jgi:NO-binding membrane sensor protein with MHYT domain